MSAIKMRTTTRKRASVSKATGSIAACDAAMRRPMVIVRAPINPFQPVRALRTKLPTMEKALEAMLGNYARMLRENPGKVAPHSITLHEDRCPFGVMLWPRASSGPDLDDMHEHVAERDEHCRCKPLVLYPGAFA